MTASHTVPEPVNAKPTVPKIHNRLINTVQNFLLAFKSVAAPINGMQTMARMLLAAIMLVHKSVAQEASPQITPTK